MFVVADATDGDYSGVTINGRRDPPPLVVKAGYEYRMRLPNVAESATVDVSLRHGDGILPWRALAKDGALLPASLQVPTEPGHLVLSQRVRVE